MNTLYKGMVVVLVLIGLWIGLACTGHCEEQCHPKQHLCNTDLECQIEEAEFLRQEQEQWNRIERALQNMPPIKIKDNYKGVK